MRYRRRKRDDHLASVATTLVIRVVQLSKDMPPMKGVALGLILLVIFCGIPSAVFDTLGSSGTRTGAVILPLLGMLAKFLALLGGLGAVGCFICAGHRLMTHREREAYVVPQAILIVAAFVSVLAYGSSSLGLFSRGEPRPPVGHPSVAKPALTPAPAVDSPQASTSPIQRTGYAPQNVITNATQTWAASVQQETNFSLVDIQFLNARKLKVLRESRCVPYVDMALAASHPDGYTTAAANLAKQRVVAALEEGWRAGCFVHKTRDELLPPTLKLYWQNNEVRLLRTEACGKYHDWAEETVYADASESERQYQLSRLFAEAAQKQCWR